MMFAQSLAAVGSACLERRLTRKVKFRDARRTRIQHDVRPPALREARRSEALAHVARMLRQEQIDALDALRDARQYGIEQERIGCGVGRVKNPESREMLGGEPVEQQGDGAQRCAVGIER